MRIQLLLISVLFPIVSIFSNNSIGKTFGKISYEKAINLSGKQRMLSQKIAKVKVLKFAGASSVELKNELTSSMTLFERNLKILDINASNQSAKVKAMIRQERSEWDRFKNTLNKPNVPVFDVLDGAEALLTKCHQLVVAIEEESKFNKQLEASSKMDQLRVETVNTAGKQRMLTQKMCLYYASCRAFKKGKNADIACNEYKNLYNQMDNVVNDLMVSELNNGEIDATLAKILDIMDNEINNQRKDFIDNKIPLQKVLNTSDRLLTLFNELTNQYSL